MAGGRRIRLSVTGTQFPPRQEMEGLPPEERQRCAVTTRVRADAEYYRRADSHYLFYEEDLEGQSEPLKTRVKFREGFVEVTRQGGIESRMVFEPGKSRRTEYPTPYGKLFLDVVTDRVRVEKRPENVCPRVTVEYVLENAGQQMGSYFLEIEELETEEPH